MEPCTFSIWIDIMWHCNRVFIRVCSMFHGFTFHWEYRNFIKQNIKFSSFSPTCRLPTSQSNGISFLFSHRNSRTTRIVLLNCSRTALLNLLPTYSALAAPMVHVIHIALVGFKHTNRTNRFSFISRQLKVLRVFLLHCCVFIVDVLVVQHRIHNWIIFDLWSIDDNILLLPPNELEFSAFCALV